MLSMGHQLRQRADPTLASQSACETAPSRPVAKTSSRSGPRALRAIRELTLLGNRAAAGGRSSIGNPHGMMDCIRHAGVETVMQTLIQDLRYSVRQLIKSPGFTLTAVISLALGIGATTAVFSVIYAALIDPYPFRAADRIVRMSVRTKAGSVETVNLNSRRFSNCAKWT